MCADLLFVCVDFAFGVCVHPVFTETMQKVARMPGERCGAQRKRSFWRGGAGEKNLGKNPHSPKILCASTGFPMGSKGVTTPGVKEEDDADSLEFWSPLGRRRASQHLQGEDPTSPLLCGRH